MIELLVVVTIIVILLALLMPGLDKAIYQAELTKCASNLKAISGGAVVYSQCNKQMFPYRTAIEAQPVIGGSTVAGGQNVNGTRVQYADVLKTTPAYRYRRINTLAEGKYDDRNLLFEFIPHKSLLDPLCGGDQIDLTNADVNNTVYIYSDYALFFGMKYEKWGHMRKFGTPMRITDHFYTTMAVDLNVYFDQVTELSSVTSHPDKDAGKTTLQVRNNTGGFLDSSWIVRQTDKRGLIDTNQSFWDGAVRRFEDCEWNKTDQPDNNEFFSDGTWQADGNWYMGAVEMWGESGDQGSFPDNTRPAATFNP